MDARNLVGMTEGAKKRAARVHFMRCNYEMSVCSNRYALVLFSPSDATTENYKRFRGIVRIGQRLRPCPGCHGCMQGVNGWHIDKVRGRYRMPTTAWCCEGSGVLPAKKAKVPHGLG